MAFPEDDPIRRRLDLFSADLEYGEPSRTGVVSVEAVREVFQMLGVRYGMVEAASVDDTMTRLFDGAAEQDAATTENEATQELLSAVTKVIERHDGININPEVSGPLLGKLADFAEGLSHEFTVTVTSEFRDEAAEKLTEAGRVLSEYMEHNSLGVDLVALAGILSKTPKYYGYPSVLGIEDIPRKGILLSPKLRPSLIDLLNGAGDWLLKAHETRELGARLQSAAKKISESPTVNVVVVANPDPLVAIDFVE